MGRERLLNEHPIDLVTAGWRWPEKSGMFFPRFLTPKWGKKHGTIFYFGIPEHRRGLKTPGIYLKRPKTHNATKKTQGNTT